MKTRGRQSGIPLVYLRRSQASWHENVTKLLLEAVGKIFWIFVLGMGVPHAARKRPWKRHTEWNTIKNSAAHNVRPE